MKHPRSSLEAHVAGMSLVLATALVMPMREFDAPLFLALNGLHSPISDLLWLSLTTLGDGLLLAVMLGCFLFVNPRVTVLGLALMLLSALFVHTFKALIPGSRPVELLNGIHVLGPVLRSGSFPSGHAAASLSAALAVAHLSPATGVKIGAICLGLLIGVSRVFVGAHFPSDVIGGWMCALAAYLPFIIGAWSEIEVWIPDRPTWSGGLFFAAVVIQALAAISGMIIHSEYFAELPAVSFGVSSVVLIYMVRECRSARGVGRRGGPS